MSSHNTIHELEEVTTCLSAVGVLMIPDAELQQCQRDQVGVLLAYLTGRQQALIEQLQSKLVEAVRAA